MNETPFRYAPGSRARVIDGTTVVELSGEIDILAAPHLWTRLDPLTAGPCPDLVLDLRPVSFIDCSGLAVLCRTRNRVLDRGGRLRLVISSPRILRILRCTGLGHAFEVTPDLPAHLARARVPHGPGACRCRGPGGPAA
ncbi:STAS domain-containing protein [Streptomyces sp. NPDC057877]|uniref:STAS domain-containing protein n=1 Tax=Streptomyces sp. NPDC057877 TaxID=3346269 RepID=UPI0036B083D3